MKEKTYYCPILMLVHKRELNDANDRAAEAGWDLVECMEKECAWYQKFETGGGECAISAIASNLDFMSTHQ